ncbi:DUF4157 domain-containing protein [Isoptericola sp. NPDC057559]|uniref:eCIS core domain-containing protein n=1 Tax=Isoptericola sp. NPDC057559 TaxID=3346168 RepID=UPI0036C79948
MPLSARRSTDPERERRDREASERAADADARRAVGADRAAGAVGPRRGTETDTIRELGAAMGHDFSRVRLHDDATAHAVTRRLGAEAVTVGNDVLFAPGRRGSPGGRSLLAHELAHVRQQSRTGPRVQAKLVATGSAQDFVDMVNQIVTVQHRVQVSASGEVSIVDTNVAGPPTRSQTELLARLRSMIADSATTTVDFIHGNTSRRAGDASVVVGSYDLARVDLDDVTSFGFDPAEARTGDNAATQLVHELTEQQRRQVHGEAFAQAHQTAYAAQEQQLGARMVSETPMTPGQGTSASVTTTYRYPDGREVDVVTTFDTSTGRITNVQRVVRPPATRRRPGRTR